MDRNDVEILERHPAFQGHYRLNRYRLRHRRFAGGWTEPLQRELFEPGRVVVVLPYDPVRDAVVLIEQFRIGAYIAGFAPWLIEVVAGFIDGDEPPPDAARRETQEEIGCAVADLIEVCRFLPSPGGSSESATLYCGRVDTGGIGGIHGVPHEHEDIRATVWPSDAAIALLAEGRVVNAPALIALQWLALHRSSVRERWLGAAAT